MIVRLGKNVFRQRLLLFLISVSRINPTKMPVRIMGELIFPADIKLITKKIVLQIGELYYRKHCTIAFSFMNSIIFV